MTKDSEKNATSQSMWLDESLKYFQRFHVKKKQQYIYS